MEDFISILKMFGLVLSPVVTALVAWWASRRKTRIEAAGLELANLERGLKMWKEMVNDLEGVRDELRHEVAELRKENHSLNLTLAQARRENYELTNKLTRLETLLNKINPEIYEAIS